MPVLGGQLDRGAQPGFGGAGPAKPPAREAERLPGVGQIHRAAQLLEQAQRLFRPPLGQIGPADRELHFGAVEQCERLEVEIAGLARELAGALELPVGLAPAGPIGTEHPQVVQRDGAAAPVLRAAVRPQGTEVMPAGKLAVAADVGHDAQVLLDASP